MDKLLKEALDKYFNNLSISGYQKPDITNTLLVLMMLQELLTDFKCFITSEDYGKIHNALNCLYGRNCLIPYSEYRAVYSPVKCN